MLGDDGLTYELIGATFLAADRPDDAAAAFQKVNDLAPKSLELPLNLAQVEEKSHHPAEALSKLDAYFAAKPANVSLASLELLKTVLNDFKQPGQLVPRLEKLHESLPESPTVNYFLAEQYRGSGKLAESKPLYEAVLKKGPTAEAYRAPVEINLKLDDRGSLLKLLGDIVEKSGSFEVVSNELKSVIGDDKLAADLYQIVRDKHGKANKSDAAAFLGAASLAAERKQWDIAEEFYNLALKADPGDKGETLLTWGLALSLDEKNAAAAKVFRRGIDEGGLADDKPAFEFYLAGPLRPTARRTRHWPSSTRWLTRKSRRKPVISPGGRGSCFTPSAPAKPARPTRNSSPGSTETIRWSKIATRSAKPARRALRRLRHDARFDRGRRMASASARRVPRRHRRANDLGYLWADEGKHLDRASP